MPKIDEKVSILNGRGDVVRYASGTSSGSYFYREWNKATSSYRTRKIGEAESIDEAVGKAIDIAFELQKEEESSSPIAHILSSGVSKDKSVTTEKTFQTHKLTRKTRKQLITVAIESWLMKEQKRVDAGLLEQSTLTNKAGVLNLHLVDYLGTQGVSYTNQITLTTFDDYELFRAKTTPMNRNQEMMWIKDFLRNYCVRQKLVPGELLLDSSFLKRSKVKQTDKLRNPAINPDDWKTIIDYTRDVWRQQVRHLPNHRSWFWRNLFWHFLLFAKNTGMSGEEILKLKWKQIDIVDVGRTNSKGELVSEEICYIATIRSKTKQTREIPTNQSRELVRWKKFQEDYIEEHKLPVMITPDSYVFGNPSMDMKPMTYRQYFNSWNEIRGAVKSQMKGHRFSPHPYTLYSLRSTFIEEHLQKGTDVLTVAEMAGHSVVMTQRHYARLDLRRRGKEIAMPNYGEKETTKPKKVDLFSEEKKEEEEVLDELYEDF